MKICFASKERRLEFAQEMKDRMEHPEKYPLKGVTPGPLRSYFEGAEDKLTKKHEIAPTKK
jgi:hypothetical protein